MRQSAFALSLLIFLSLASACGKGSTPGQAAVFKDDLAFLTRTTRVLVLSDSENRAQIAVNPDLQGRIMTSTLDGADGLSFGWINRELISSGQTNPHMNAFGGEDRFWIGPEGGQFSVFFKKGDPFDLDHWFTPPPINEGAFEIVSRDKGQVHFRKVMPLTNYSGARFDLEVNRFVRLLDARGIGNLAGPLPVNVKAVAFQSDNKVTNTGASAWVKETGLLSIWVLGMFTPSPQTTVVVPFKPGPEADLGPVVNDAYFGKVPDDRLVIKEGILFFKGDGAFRSKIGVPPRRARPFAASYDAANGVLTIIHFTLPEGSTDFVNSMWRIQDDPFAGDAVNSYNDGPPSPGAKPLGPFYELESSSPAASLNPGETLSHVHTTIHFQGDAEALDRIAARVLGVGIAEIVAAFGKN